MVGVIPTPPCSMRVHKAIDDRRAHSPSNKTDTKAGSNTMTILYSQATEIHNPNNICLASTHLYSHPHSLDTFIVSFRLVFVLFSFCRFGGSRLFCVLCVGATGVLNVAA